MTTVATTILEQLGGGKFRAMTGAKDFTTDGQNLGFRLPARFAAKGITHVRITLTPADLYRVEFFKIRGVNVTTVSDFDGIYAETLRELFTRETGLDTSLGTMRARA